MIERCWICGNVGTDQHPLVQLDPSVPSKCCTRHLPIIDRTHDDYTYDI